MSAAHKKEVSSWSLHQYTTNIYLRLWEDMVEVGNMTLDCLVLISAPAAAVECQSASDPICARDVSEPPTTPMVESMLYHSAYSTPYNNNNSSSAKMTDADGATAEEGIDSVRESENCRRPSDAVMIAKDVTVLDVYMLESLEAVYTLDPAAKLASAEMRRRHLQSNLSDVRVVDLGKSPFNDDMIFVDRLVKDMRPLPVFDRVAMGGTFDRLHNGHRILLSTSARVCSGRLTIGITSDAMLRKKARADSILKFPQRKALVDDFMHRTVPGLALDVVELQDPYGPPIVDPSIQAIVVSSETIEGARAINRIRAEAGFDPLAIVVIRRQATSTLSSSFLRAHIE